MVAGSGVPPEVRRPHTVAGEVGEVAGGRRRIYGGEEMVDWEVVKGPARPPAALNWGGMPPRGPRRGPRANGPPRIREARVAAQNSGGNVARQRPPEELGAARRGESTASCRVVACSREERRDASHVGEELKTP
ncbi:hypothetical protein ACP4OV_002267 [Aristida adscensionis]